ncbi:hypothetical protein [Bradyrhizobium sp. S3.2.12]|uniref:hypothetical protein n=1 Tax=Bradyrhizobium sp. S3.2.12 TaxID=3156387 RepID=UPI00339302E5
MSTSYPLPTQPEGIITSLIEASRGAAAITDLLLTLWREVISLAGVASSFSSGGG